jgi:hypothetical protein
MHTAPLSLAIATAPGAAPGAGVAPGGGKGTFFLSFFIRRRVSTFNQADERRLALRASRQRRWRLKIMAIAELSEHVLPSNQVARYLHSKQMGAARLLKNSN